MFKFFEITDETDSATVSGWVLEKFGCFPKEGDTFDYEKVTVSVLSADDQRVNEVMITVKPEESDEEEEKDEE